MEQFVRLDLGNLSASRRLVEDAEISSDGRRLIIERPWFSIRPVFLRKKGKRIDISNRWRALLREDGDSIDVGYAKDYLRFQSPHTCRSLAKHIRLLRHGERFTIEEDDVNREPLELPRPALAPKNVPDALAKKLPDADKTCFHLSSGLDSSLLALLARRKGQKVTAATLRTSGRGMSDELGVIERLADQLGIALHIFDFRQMDIWKEGRRLMSLLSYPIAHPSHLARYLLDHSIAEQGLGSRIVTGRGPDEVLGGYAAHRREFAVAREHLARVTCTAESWINALFSGTENGDAGAYHAGFAKSGVMSLEQRLLYDLGAIFEAWNIVDSDLSSGLGIEYISPFLDREVMALFMSLPEHEKIDGEQKIFLRRTFNGIYPDYLLSAPKRGLTIDLRDYMLQESAEDIVRRIWSASGFASLALKRAAVLRMVDETQKGIANHGWQIWSLYLCSLAYSKLTESAS